MAKQTLPRLESGPVAVTEAIRPVSMRIYIAGPYSANPTGCTDRAMEVMLQLMRKGHHPYCPHLSHFPDLLARRLGRPMTYDDWIELDLVWLAQCDAVLRLPGASNGADIETAEADVRGIPVYTDLSDVPNVSDSLDLQTPDWRRNHLSSQVPNRTHCKDCGQTLQDHVTRPRGTVEACPGCDGLDFSVCPDCKGALCHPGCGNALNDLGYDRLCTQCVRTFIYGDPRTYGRREA